MSRRCLADCIVQSSKQSVHKLAAQSVPQSKAYNGYLCLHSCTACASGQSSVSGSLSSHLCEPGKS